MSDFVDTSVVVRYLVDDVPALADRAAEIIEGPDNLFLTDVVLQETSYVLTSFYRMSRPTVVDALEAFVERANIRVFGLDKVAVTAGLEFCRPSNRVSFGDALVWAAARTAGDASVYTFDRRFPGGQVNVRS